MKIKEGFCQCGCGQRTSLIPQSSSSRGYVRGQHYRYIVGHNNRGNKRPLTERFWEKVNIREKDECWHWNASLRSTGYGQFQMNDTMYKSHRVAWELTNGPIPKGMFVCHTCDQRTCCNPSHLFLGSPKDNIMDMIAKGRKGIPDFLGSKNPAAKLTEKDILRIRKRSQQGEKGVTLAKDYNVTPTQICAIVRHRSWKHLP